MLGQHTACGGFFPQRPAGQIIKGHDFTPPPFHPTLCCAPCSSLPISTLNCTVQCAPCWCCTLPISTLHCVPLFTIPHTSIAIPNKIEPTPKPNQNRCHHHSKRNRGNPNIDTHATADHTGQCLHHVQACGQLHRAAASALLWSFAVQCWSQPPCFTVDYIARVAFLQCVKFVVHCCIKTIKVDSELHCSPAWLHIVHCIEGGGFSAQDTAQHDTIQHFPSSIQHGSIGLFCRRELRARPDSYLGRETCETFAWETAFSPSKIKRTCLYNRVLGERPDVAPRMTYRTQNF